MSELNLRPPKLRCPGAAKAAARAVIAAGLMLMASVVRAQDKPAAIISADASNFAISENNRIVFSVPHLKHVKKVMIERDDIAVADFGGHEKKIVEPDRFMPVPPPVSYIVNGLEWSPDGKRIAVSMTTIPAPGSEADKSDDEDNSDDDRNADNIGRKLALPNNGTKAIALFDDDGHEIKLTGAKSRFIEQASNGAWLADGQTVVYLTGIGPYKIARVRPADGQITTLFEGHTFDTVVWDAPRNRAFAVGRNLSLTGKTALVELDLLHETVREVARLANFEGQLTVSADGKKAGYFVDGDTIEVRDLANPQTPIRVRTGPGKFQFSADDQRILLKRGPVDKSGDLVWVGLTDNSWVPILHDLEFHNFALAPDGRATVVMDPGKGLLKIYPLR